jgi:hypothetical protein
VSQCFGYDPCLFCHGVHLQYRCDFQLLVSTPVLRCVTVVVHIFLVVDGKLALLVIIDDYSCSCGFYA